MSKHDSITGLWKSKSGKVCGVRLKEDVHISAGTYIYYQINDRKEKDNHPDAHLKQIIETEGDEQPTAVHESESQDEEAPF